MARVGRGNAAEETLTRQEKRRRQFNNHDFSNTESTNTNFTGSVSISDIPEKLESLNNSKQTPKPSTELSPVYRHAERLELQYQTLFEGGGLELLEAMRADEDLSEFDDKLIGLMSEQDLLTYSDQKPDFTQKGEQVRQNWVSFRDHYLTGQTDNNRMENIESKLGVEAMPWFLEETSDIEVTLDQYLRKKEGCRSRYQPEKEFGAIVGSIFGYDEDELGERIRTLDVLNHPERYDEKEVSEEICEGLRYATPLGLIDDEDVLTQDGEALYRKIRTDSYYM